MIRPDRHPARRQRRRRDAEGHSRGTGGPEPVGEQRGVSAPTGERRSATRPRRAAGTAARAGRRRVASLACTSSAVSGSLDTAAAIRAAVLHSIRDQQVRQRESSSRLSARITSPGTDLGHLARKPTRSGPRATSPTGHDRRPRRTSRYAGLLRFRSSSSAVLGERPFDHRQGGRARVNFAVRPRPPSGPPPGPGQTRFAGRAGRPGSSSAESHRDCLACALRCGFRARARGRELDSGLIKRRAGHLSNSDYRF